MSWQECADKLKTQKKKAKPKGPKLTDRLVAIEKLLKEK